MKFEQQPNIPSGNKNKAKEFKEFNGQKFEVERPEVLTVSDIQNGDRVFVITESGNRYMLRRSKSANGAIKIYNERLDKFKKGYELYNQGEIAMVGERFNFIMSLSQEEGKQYNATKVVGIEIRRGIDRFHAKDSFSGDHNEDDAKNFSDKFKK